MIGNRITFTSPLWRWSDQGKGNWHFVTIGGEAGHELAASEAMRRLELGHGRGFGSVKVSVQIGETCWQTSAFPRKGREEWVLPVKAAILRAEAIGEGDEVTAILEPL